MSDVKFKAGDRVLTAPLSGPDSFFNDRTGTVSSTGAEGEWDFFVVLDEKVLAPDGFDYSDNEFGFRAEELELIA